MLWQGEGSMHRLSRDHRTLARAEYVQHGKPLLHAAHDAMPKPKQTCQRQSSRHSCCICLLPAMFAALLNMLPI
jgi:hypothetical protein